MNLLGQPQENLIFSRPEHDKLSAGSAVPILLVCLSCHSIIAVDHKNYMAPYYQVEYAISDRIK